MSLTVTAIPYLTRTFGAARGCSMGCSYCSTARWSHRLACPQCRRREVHFHAERLDDLFRAKQPQVVGHSFYDELFDPTRPEMDVARVLAACEQTPWHQHVFLTKRPEQVARWCGLRGMGHDNWWVGVTAETQELLEARAPALLGLGMRHLWLSIEPMLGPVDPTAWLGRRDDGRGSRLDGYEFVVVGSQSGDPGLAVEKEIGWLEACHQLVLACRGSNVPVFVKQIPVGKQRPAGGRCSRNPAEWPEHLRVQELPPAWAEIVNRRRT